MDYLKYLTDIILPYWIKITPDKEAGGVFTVFNEDGSVGGTDKRPWFQGRALWSYSMAYRLCEPKQEYLDICEHIFKFFDKCTLAGNRLAYVCNREGTAKTVRDIYYYSEMFAAMGCAQYYRICKNPEVKNTAEAFFDTVYDLYVKNKNTTQEIGVDTECKTFGLHMAMLATAQFVRNAGINTKKADEAAHMCIDELMYGGYVDDVKKQIHEYVSMSGEKLDRELGTASCPGHIYEAAWFILCEGEIKNDDIIRNFGKKLIDYAMPDDFDKITNIIPTMRNLSIDLSECLNDNYFAWPQQEAIIAYRLAYNIFNENKYLELSEKIENMMFAYFEKFDKALWITGIHKENGSFCESKGKSPHISGPFHFERMLLALGTMKETGNILKYMS